MPVLGEITFGTLDGMPVVMEVEVVAVPVAEVDD
jgi:hypothetical protein